jgi:long-subunit acyl-CoA synthetase (AMP-forming)
VSPRPELNERRRIPKANSPPPPRRIGSAATTTKEAQTCAKWAKYFDDGMEVANNQTTSRAQRITKWTLLDTDFTEPTGELTPTLKLKRSVAADNHSKAIEDMY